MRKLFSLKSSSSKNKEDDKRVPPDPRTEKDYLDKFDEKSDVGNKYVGNEEPHIPCHKRSASLSSLPHFTGTEYENLSTISRPRTRLTSRCHSPFTERKASPNRDLDMVQYGATDNTHTPRSSRNKNRLSSDSPFCSPVPLRCRSARIQHVTDSSNSLDPYIDGQQNDVFYSRNSHTYFSDCSQNNVYIGKPSRAPSATPSLPTHTVEDLRTRSFREVSESRLHDPPKVFYRHIKKKFDNIRSNLFPGENKSQDCDSEASAAVEDIHIDTSDPLPTSHSTCAGRQYSSSDCTLPYESSNNSCGENRQGFSSLRIDEDLLDKVKEIEHMLTVMSNEELELEMLKNNNTLDISKLIQMTKNIVDERKSLALELSSQLKSRLAERVSARDGFKSDRFELETRTRRMQLEKGELQSSLEKELDRRSTDWSMKVEKFQSEESRLRERVRELAEQNVSLQRELSSLKDSEESIRSRTLNSEIQMNDLSSSLEEARAENHNLHRELEELQESFKVVEQNLNCTRKDHNMKEMENKELQMSVIRLQRMCNEQEKSINGLRQVYSDETGNKASDCVINMLQMEQLRLISVEHMLRKEIESCRCDIDCLRHENMSLLNRLQANRNENRFYLLAKVDEEFQARIECLQNQGISLLNEHSQFCNKILNLTECKQYEEDGYICGEFAAKYQSLRREIENFRGSLITVAKLSSERGNIVALDTESSLSKQKYECQESENELEVELKAEILVCRLLKEKVYSKEMELQELQSRFAWSVHTHDILQSEMQRLQDELSCLVHKSRDAELQITRKNDNINQLQQDLQECTKELTSTRSMLVTVREERDRMWDEVKSSKESAMLLDLEVNSLKKKIEDLDEHILIKEGQISILKDRLVEIDKPFDIYSPKFYRSLPKFFFYHLFSLTLTATKCLKGICSSG